MILFVTTLFFIFPFLWTFLTSLKPNKLIFTIPPTVVFKPTLEHYVTTFKTTNFLQISINSLIIAGGTTAVVIVLGSLAAYAFARYRHKYNRPLLYTLLIARMIPPVAAIMPLFIIFFRLKLLDTYIAVIVAHSAFYISFSVWLMRAFFITIPAELEDAALIDGASRLQSLFRIFIPLAAPGLIVAIVFTFSFSWNELLYAVTFTSNQARTLPVLAAQYKTTEGIDWGPLTAASCIIITPILIFASIIQRYMLSGLTMGAVKE